MPEFPAFFVSTYTDNSCVFFEGIFEQNAILLFGSAQFFFKKIMLNTFVK